MASTVAARRISTSALSFKPVNRDRWRDFESLFESVGSPHYCWCTAWRRVDSKDRSASKQEKKACIKSEIGKNNPVGIIAYHHKEPIAWCSVAPRESFKALGGDDTINNVWSITCFFIKRPFRGMGISRLLLENAVAYAGKEGAAYVEAYPVAADSPSYRYMGIREFFEKAGFSFRRKAGSRRNVMVLELGR